MSYAGGTEVPIERSKTEIEKILGRYGATSFMYATNAMGAAIAFEARGRRIRMVVPMPDKKSLEVTERGVIRTELQHENAFAQAQRQRWRALALVVKAKLEATQSGIASFEEEFMNYIVLPGKRGQTVGEWLLPQLDDAYKNNAMPPLLNLGPARPAGNGNG